MKKSILIGILSTLLLVGCQVEKDRENLEKQQETENEVKEEKNQDELVAVKAEQNLVEYEWKTNYAILLEDYITINGFWNLEFDQFDHYSSGVAAAKLVFDQNREVPYLAILYGSTPSSSPFMPITTIRSKEVDQDMGVYLDIWDIQNGEPVRIAHEYQEESGLAGDLAVAFVETADGETMLRYTSEDVGQTYHYSEKFYRLSDLQTPVYELIDESAMGEQSDEGKYIGSEAVTGEEYKEKRHKLNYKVEKWIESYDGDKSISDELAPVIQNVLAFFESLDTDNLTTPKDVLAIEEQAIYNRLANLKQLEDDAVHNNFINREQLEAGLRRDEKIYFSEGLYQIQGGIYDSSGMKNYYPKVVMDFYSEANFGFVLDETTFDSIANEQHPGYQNGTYIYHVSGGVPYPSGVIYVADIKKIEKIENSLYSVQLEEFNFDFSSYSESPDYEPIGESDSLKYHGIPKSEWPEDMNTYMISKGTKYALFKKNKYGFALLQYSAKPIEDFSGEAEKGRVLTSKEQEKKSYLNSLDNAYQLSEVLYDNEVNLSKLLQAHDAWDVELNKIYGLLKEKLSANEMDDLRESQRNWIKDRDSLAGNPNEVGEWIHWKTRLEMTMDKTLELVDMYFD